MTTVSSRRRILVVSYPHPPMPSVGGNRWLAMSKYLRRAGYDVELLGTTSAFGSLPDDGELSVHRAGDLDIFTAPSRRSASTTASNARRTDRRGHPAAGNHHEARRSGTLRRYLGPGGHLGGAEAPFGPTLRLHCLDICIRVDSPHSSGAWWSAPSLGCRLPRRLDLPPLEAVFTQRTGAEAFGRVPGTTGGADGRDRPPV